MEAMYQQTTNTYGCANCSHSCLCLHNV